MKKKIISLTIIITSIVCIIGIVVFAAITDAINEKHSTSLAPNKLLVNNDEYYTYNNDSSFSITITNYENGFDLVAIASDSSDGRLLYTYNPATYNSNELVFNGNECVCTINPELNSSKTYYIMAINYTKYNKFVTSYEDLALLNSEYRHSVINDDLRIGNVTDFYNSIGDYIGNDTFDISRGVYDFYGNIIPRITNGVNTYTLPYGTSLEIDLSEYHRADFYTKSEGNYVITDSSLSITPATTSTGLYDKYGRIINHIYLYNNRTFDNYVFTSAGVLFNGKKLDANKTIDLTKAYFDNGIVVDDAYDSSIFRNIYVLNDINVTEKLDLIMPCNIHLLNNDIIVSEEMNLKHYYTMNYVIDGKALGGDSAGTFRTKDGTGKAIAIKTPNANANITITDTYLDVSKIDSKTNLLDDVLDFAQSYFVDYILVDKYYQVPSRPKKLVSYDYIDIFQGLYEMNDDGTLEAKRTVTDDNGIDYTIEYDGDSYIENTSTYLPTSVTVGDANNYTWYIKYKSNGSIDYVYRIAGSGETKDDTIVVNGEEKDIIKYGTDISYIIDKSSEAEYYTLFLTNPVLPTSFYDENVTIKYYFADNSWTSTGETFHVSSLAENQQRHVLIQVSDGTTTKTARVNSWLMGSSAQAVLETVALKLEVDINRGFASETTTSVLINYDTIEDIYGDYEIEFSDSGHATYNEIELEVPSTPAGQKHQFIKVTRNSFSITDGFGELEARIVGATDVDPVTIYVQLRKISESYYDEMIKNEIGQVFFNDEHTEYDLPNENDLVKYNVKTVDYEVRVSYDGGLTTQRFSGITFEKDGTRYYLDKGSTSNSNNFELYLQVYLKLNDDTNHSLMTKKILFAQGTTGGEGENSYIENLFEEDFALISNFIGLSNPFKVDDANIRFYMEMDNNDDYSFIDIYVKYVISPDGDNIASINGDRSGSIPAGTYTYLDGSLNRSTITISDDLVAGNSIPISDGGNQVKELYIPLTSETRLTTTTNIVFLTDASQIGKTDTPITVYTYLTDTGLDTGKKIKASFDSFAHYDLFDGLYNAVGSKIKEITDGNITYVINYTDDTVTSVVKTEGGVTEIFTGSLKIDLTGFYYNNFIGRLASVGTQVNLAKGIYSENVNWTPITTFESNGVTYTITYDENGEVTDIEGIDINGDPVTSYTVTITSADLAGDRTIYTRNSAQQTIFFKKTGEDEYSAITMYKQVYSFNVPGIYKDTDFNLTSQYDLYSKIKENYTDELFDEINGNNYYLLSKTVEEAERLVIDLTSEQSTTTTIAATRLGYFKKLKYLEIRYAVFDGGKYSEFITQTGVKDGVNLSYIHNSLETLILDHCKTNKNDESFANFKQLTKFVYTNNYFSGDTLANVVPTLYRRLTYLDLSNNKFSDISRLNTLINLEYLDLRNNEIKTFDKLAYDSKGEKAITTLKTLYIDNNTVDTTVTLGSATIKPYGTPSYNNDGTINNGAVNVTTLIQILDNNPELKLANNGANDFENDNINSYRKSAYILNAIMYMNRYDDNLSLDITPILSACTVNGVYMTVKAQASYTTLTATPSPSYTGNGYYTTSLTADAEYEIIISITYTDADSSNTFTIYREIYFKEGTLTTN